MTFGQPAAARRGARLVQRAAAAAGDTRLPEIDWIEQTPMSHLRNVVVPGRRWPRRSVATPFLLPLPALPAPLLPVALPASLVGGAEAARAAEQPQPRPT